MATTAKHICRDLVLRLLLAGLLLFIATGIARAAKHGTSGEAPTLTLRPSGIAGLFAAEGRALPGRLVSLHDEEQALATTEAGPDGAWRASPEAPLSPGRHAITARTWEGDQGPSTSDPWIVYVVRPGDSLWRIALEIYGDGERFRAVYLANQDEIGDPDLIFPGQLLLLPEAPIVDPDLIGIAAGPDAPELVWWAGTEPLAAYEFGAYEVVSQAKAEAAARRLAEAEARRLAEAPPPAEPDPIVEPDPPVEAEPPVEADPPSTPVRNPDNPDAAQGLNRSPPTVKEPATPATPADGDFQAALATLLEGAVAYNVPPSMQVGDIAGIEAVVSFQQIEAELKAQVEEPGEIEFRVVQVSDVMGAWLEGIGFDIKPEEPVEQIVDRTGFAKWNWQIRAQVPGEQTLLLKLSAVVTIDGKDRQQIEVLKEKILVQVVPKTWLDRIGEFIDKPINSMITLGTFIAMVAGAYGWLRKRRKRKAVSGKPKGEAEKPEEPKEPEEKPDEIETSKTESDKPKGKKTKRAKPKKPTDPKSR